jgi:predicted secreted protein
LSVALAHETLAPLTELPKEVTLRAGMAQALDLPSLAGGGYVWTAEVEDEAIAEASTRFRPATAARHGGQAFSRTELLTLRGLSVGTTRVHLAQRRAWEKGVEPVAAHTLTVNVVAPAAK